MIFFIDQETCFGKNYIVNILGFLGQNVFVATTQPYYSIKTAKDNT